MGMWLLSAEGHKWWVEMEERTVTRFDGWVFLFKEDADESGAFNGECIKHPERLRPEEMHRAASIAREAGDVFLEALHRSS